MAWNPSTEEGIAFTFDGGNLEHRTLEIVSFTGTEAISTPYAYELELVSETLDLDSAPLLREPAWIRIKQKAPATQRGIITLKVHGRLSEFEYRESDGKIAIYRATLVPRLWFLSLTKQSRIFQRKSVPDIVREVLLKNGFTPDDFSFRLSGSYPTREYVVQYQESDLQFISRLLEHEGIFYAFEHGEERETVLFGDSSAAYGRVQGGEQVPFRPLSDIEGAKHDLFDEPVVHSFLYRHRRVQKSVALQDYNWRTPRTELEKAAPVVADGVGEVYEFGDHYKEPGEGARLVQVRAEELKCREKTFEGTSRVKAFRAGATFDLTENRRPDFNGRFLLTKVVHKGEQAIALGGPTRPIPKYHNDFVAIPAAMEFRPERTTPKPKIDGVLTAWVDAAGDGKYAEVDDLGRYKVQTAFDRSGISGGQASRHVRMAQPHAGPDMGIHFPLRKETEVLLVHANGDPDRPIIIGAMPDPETKSPVIGQNQTQNVIRTGGGTEIRIEDTQDNEFFHLKVPRGDTHLAVGAPHHGSPQSLDGVMVATKDVISLNAGKSVSIHAAAPDHDAGTQEGANRLGAIGTAGSVLSTVLGFADAPSGGIAGTALGLLTLGSGQLSSLLKNETVHISAPAEASIIGNKSATIGSLITTNVIGAVTTSVLSAGQTLVGAVLRCAMVAGGDADVISGANHVHIKAGTAPVPAVLATGGGNVEVQAFQDFTVDANHEIKIVAGQPGHPKNLGEIWIESANPEGKKIKIVLKVGDSKITMSEDEIFLNAKRICLKANDGEAVLDLGKGTSGGAPFFAKCEKKMWLKSDTEVQVTSPKKIFLKSDEKFVLNSDKLTLTAKTEGKMGGGDLYLDGFKNVYTPSAHSF